MPNLHFIQAVEYLQAEACDSRHTDADASVASPRLGTGGIPQVHRPLSDRVFDHLNEEVLLIHPGVKPGKSRCNLARCGSRLLLEPVDPPVPQCRGPSPNGESDARSQQEVFEMEWIVIGRSSLIAVWTSRPIVR